MSEQLCFIAWNGKVADSPRLFNRNDTQGIQSAMAAGFLRGNLAIGLWLVKEKAPN